MVPGRPRWRTAAASAVERVWTAAFGRPCVGCQELPGRPGSAFCGPCAGTIAANDGPRCPACDVPAEPAAAAGPCPACSRAAAAPAGLGRVRLPLCLEGPCYQALRAAKFAGQWRLAEELAHRLLEDRDLCCWLRAADAVTFVPSHWRRTWSRGYQWAGLLARALARGSGRPLVSLLVRRRPGPPQSSLPHGARAANVQGAFAARQPVAGALVLVDDAFTTGATLREAARCLMAAGASRVDGACLGVRPP